MGWLDKSPEMKAEECPECAGALAASKKGEGPVNVCERCGHLYLATCNCDLE
jgi:DNA-directed RNA polymerase subunit M/transcription elongation factor TFIIS